MEEDKNIPKLIKVEAQQDSYRWVAMTAMLLAIGIILHTVSPNVGGVTPNWTIAMYTIVICITKLSIKQAMGIGLIAGLTLVPSSKSAFPLGNLASDFAGATVCWLLVRSFAVMGLKNFYFRPYIIGFLSTMTSGGVFTLILKFILGLPWHVWIFAMLPVVAAVGVCNGFVVHFLYPPVRKLFFIQEGKE